MGLDQGVRVLECGFKDSDHGVRVLETPFKDSDPMNRPHEQTP